MMKSLSYSLLLHGLQVLGQVLHIEEVHGVHDRVSQQPRSREVSSLWGVYVTEQWYMNSHLLAIEAACGRRGLPLMQFAGDSCLPPQSLMEGLAWTTCVCDLASL